MNTTNTAAATRFDANLAILVALVTEVMIALVSAIEETPAASSFSTDITAATRASSLAIASSNRHVLEKGHASWLRADVEADLGPRIDAVVAKYRQPARSSNNIELKVLARAVRKSLKAAGVKASVRCSSSTTSECLRVVVSDVSASMRANLNANLDTFDGLISEDKAFNNATVNVIGAMVSRHVTPIESSRYVSVTSTVRR